MHITMQGQDFQTKVVQSKGSYVEWQRSIVYRMGLWTSARCVIWSPVVVRMAIKLKYRNTPKKHTDTYHTYILITNGITCILIICIILSSKFNRYLHRSNFFCIIFSSATLIDDVLQYKYTQGNSLIQIWIHLTGSVSF